MVMDLVDSIGVAARQWSGLMAERVRAGHAVWQHDVARFGSMPLTSMDARDVPLSGANALVLAQSMLDRGWDDPRFFTAAQVAGLGASVRPGAVAVEAPFIRVNGADGALAEAPALVVYPLFNAADVQGLPEWVPPARHWSLEVLADRLLPSFDVEIVHDQVDRAFFSSTDGKVHMPPPEMFDSLGQYVGVAVHELAHGSREELQREVTGTPGDVSYAREELRAEIASMHLSIALGIPHDLERHRGFAEAWASDLEANPLEFFRAAKDAERMAALVLRHVQSLEKFAEIEREMGIGGVGEVMPAPSVEPVAAAPVPVVERSVYVVYGTGKAECESVKWAAEAFVREPLSDDLGVVRMDFGPGLPATGLGTVVGQVEPVKGGGLARVSAGGDVVFEGALQRALQDAVLALSVEKVVEPVGAADGEEVPQRVSRKEVRKANYSARAHEEFPHRQAVLQVPFEQRREAYALGAMFHDELRLWFVPRGVPMEPLRRWTVEAQQALALSQRPSEGDLIADFERVLEKLNVKLKPGEAIQADGQWHHCKAADNKGNPSNRSASYLLDLAAGGDGQPVGVVMNRYSGLIEHWRPDMPGLTPEEAARMRAEAQARAEAQDRKVQARYELVASESQAIWDRSVEGSHGYFDKKAVLGHGCRVVDGAVLLEYSAFKSDEGKSAVRRGQHYALVPIRDLDGKLWALQAIGEDGTKIFMTGGRKKGCFAVLGSEGLVSELPATGLVAFGEGFATLASLQERSPVKTAVVCFDAGNLEAVGKLLGERREKGEFSGIVPVIAADNDQFFMERAFGLLAKVGIVAHGSMDGPCVSVVSGMNASRKLPLGEVVVDGAWHQGPSGRYCVEIKPDEAMPECAGSVKVAIELTSGEKESMQASNRGLVAGRVALQAMGGVLALPEFDSLRGRPTDWNDLAVRGGDVAGQVLACIKGHEGLLTKLDRPGQAVAGKGVLVEGRGGR